MELVRSNQPSTLAWMFSGLGRKVQQLDQRTLLGAATRQGVGFVMRTALLEVAISSDLEAQLIKMSPLSEPRNKALVDAGTGRMVAELYSL